MPEARKAAAAIILSKGPAPQVLLARRSDTLKFAPGHHVFPGGRVEANEGYAHVLGAADSEEATYIHAVAREVFEETGLLCTVGAHPDPEALRRTRQDMLRERAGFDAILERFSLRIDARHFTPAGVWLTPDIFPIRFDTRYYVYHAKAGQHEELIPGEIVGLEWLDPAQARRHWREGRLKLSPPVAYVLHYLAHLPLDQALPHLERTVDRSPGVPSRLELRCGIHLLPVITPTLPPATHTNCIVIGDQELLVIDPGPTDEEEQAHLLEQIEHFADLGARVTAILLTHSHIDHIGAAPFLREKLGAPIWAHPRTADQLTFPIDRALTDGEIIEVAGTPPWRVRCVHTPGHDPGHLCFLEETTHTLVAGDMVANPGTIVISLEFGGDMTEYLTSLEQLADESFRLLIPGHGLPPGRPKEQIRGLIAHRLERERKIKHALDQGLTGLDDLIAAVYGEVNRDVWPIARHSLEAHLKRLGHGLHHFRA